MKRVHLALLGLALAGCSSDDAEDETKKPGWSPDDKLASLAEPSGRGLLDRRGLIHAHSVYSHDACDGEPRENETGPINQACFDDFRSGLCATRHDFVMLTDHRGSFSDTEYPDVLLYRSDLGDTLVERSNVATANWLACPEQDPALVLAGCESATMPVGLEGHVATRGEAYGSATPEAIQTFKDQGAVALVQHTEDFSVDQLVDLPIDGFEMYNLHANTFRGAGEALALLNNLDTPEWLPHPDLVLLPIFSEDPRYLERWAGALARGARRVTTMGTDCHRNTFQQELPDGERIDSYRRMMGWFSNHLLIVPEADGSWDDRHLKEALRAGRLYGAFEVLGYPEGFDFHALEGDAIREMGSEVSLAAGSQLVVQAPRVRELGSSPAPELTLRVLLARETSWELVAEGDGTLEVSPSEPGAYRAEVRMRPRHLEGLLGSYTDLVDRDFVWIYSNPIYVTD